MKKWYKSKTLWVNGIAIVAGLVTRITGIEVGAQESAAVLALVNLVLRIVTKEAIEK